MMDSVTHHLVRRGMETFQTQFTTSGGSEPKIQIPGWGLTLVASTVLLFVFMILSIEYTYGNLVVTLAAVEAPRQTAIITTAPVDDDHPDAPLISIDEKNASQKEEVERQVIEEVTMINQPPLTSRFCAIIRHLRARAGRLSRYRGAHILVINSLLYNLFVGFVSIFCRPQTLGHTIGQIVVYVGFTNLQLLWTHVVISEPRAESFLQRMPPRSVVKKALLQNAAYAAITKLAALSIVYVAPVLGFGNVAGGKPSADVQEATWTLIALTIYGLAITIGILIPAKIGITRVRASLLSEQDEPIIPFDRTFNGDVVPESEGGKGYLTLNQAIKGCDMVTRYRVLGVYLKAAVMQIAVMFLGMAVVIGELRLILGPEFVLRLRDIVEEANRPH